MTEKLKAFDILKKAILQPCEWGNNFIPGVKIQSTAYPKEKLTYNEIHQHINNQIK